MSDFRSFLNEQLKDPEIRREYRRLWPQYMLKQMPYNFRRAVRRFRCRLCRMARRRKG